MAQRLHSILIKHEIVLSDVDCYDYTPVDVAVKLIVDLSLLNRNKNFNLRCPAGLTHCEIKRLADQHYSNKKTMTLFEFMRFLQVNKEYLEYV